MLGSRKTREGKVATVRPRDGELSHERFSCLRVLLGRVLFHITVARVSILLLRGASHSKFAGCKVKVY